MTIAEKIMSTYAGRPVRAGEYVTVTPEYVLFCEMQWHHSIERALKELDLDRIWNPDRVVIIPDHRIPANIPFFADVLRTLREFVTKYGVKHFYDIGRGGIRNQVFLDEGFVWPGSLILTDEPNINSSFGIVGALGFGESVKIAEVLAIGETWFRVPETIRISLTGRLAPGVMTRDVSLYLSRTLGQDAAEAKMVEFDGPAIPPLSLDERNTLAQQPPLTMGALSSLMVPDDVALNYVRARSRKQDFEVVRPDPDATYAAQHTADVSVIPPQVSPPPLSSTAVPVANVVGTPIHQAYIGSCSSARLNDLRVAAQILRGRHVHADTRMIAVPISQRVLLDAMAEGVIQTLVEAGVSVAAPSCGACPGGHAGVLGRGENCITTTSHNYPGRMGSDKATIFLASPATVAASAIEGKIADPRKYLS